MKNLLEYIVSSIIDNPDDLAIEKSSDESGMVGLKFKVHPDDMGRVIGKSGKTIQAIRTLMRVAAVRKGQRVRLELIEPEADSDKKTKTSKSEKQDKAKEKEAKPQEEAIEGVVVDKSSNQ